jgi:hypothetical protein
MPPRHACAVSASSHEQGGLRPQRRPVTAAQLALCRALQLQQTNFERATYKGAGQLAHPPSWMTKLRDHSLDCQSCVCTFQHLLLHASCDLHAGSRCTDLLNSTPSACRVKLRTPTWDCTALSSVQNTWASGRAISAVPPMLITDVCDRHPGPHVISTADLGSRGVMQMPLPPSVQSYR